MVNRFPKRPALTASALLVLAIAAFSYLFTIAVAIACVYLPLELLAFLSSLHQFQYQAYLLVLGGVIIAGLLVWSIFPRKQRFVEPGVAFDLSEHPRLRELIIEVTGQLNERVPDAVYFTPYANASVNEHGGWFGYGSKRVLSIGFSLLVTLNKSEFRAVLSHECAHYYGGDTVLLPVERSARTAMARVLSTLVSDSDFKDAVQKVGAIAALHSVVSIVMSLYWRALIRLSSFISHAQEFRCDELACYLAGVEATLSALEKVERVSCVEVEFWSDAIVPLLARGTLPHISASLTEFLAKPHIAAAADEAFHQRLKNEKTDPESTHPPLRQRLDRIRRFQGEPGKLDDEERAICLINDVDAQELAMVTLFFRDDSRTTQLKRVDWDCIPQMIYIPEWRSFAQSHSSLLQGLTVADVPRILNDPDSLVGLVPNPPGRLFTREQRAQTAREVIIAACLLRLLDAGWTCVIRPGVKCFIKGAEQLQPWAILRQIPIDRKQWEELCAREEILETPLHLA